MRTLGLVPARGGSKRLPQKNLATLGGTTLVRRALETCCAAETLAAVALSTDDAAILAEADGLAVHRIERPAHLATDEARTHAVVVHALDQLDGDFDAVAVVQCTAPFTLPADVDATVRLLDSTGADAAVTVMPVANIAHPAKLKRMEGDRLVPFLADDRMAPSHELPPLWVRNGSVYAARRATIEAGSLDGPDTRGYVMPPERSLDIDTELDLAFAEFLLARGPDA